MRIRRRNLRKLLVAAGCLVGSVSWPWAAIGGGLLLAGGGLHLWSKGCLEQNRRLTTVGPYRWTRNPFYLANLLVDLGLCCVIGRWWVAAVFVPIWFVSYRETIAREEARLRELFPESFPDYAAAVPRLFPTGRRLPAADARGSFDWNNDALARGSEYARLLGVALAAGAIGVAEVLRRDRLAFFAADHGLGLAAAAFLAAGWIVKLGLAETFRRPQHALVPFADRPGLRLGVTLVWLGAALAIGRVWALSGPALWMALLALDRLGAARVAGRGATEGGRRELWPRFPAVAAGTIAGFASLAALERLVAG